MDGTLLDHGPYVLVKLGACMHDVQRCRGLSPDGGSVSLHLSIDPHGGGGGTGGPSAETQLERIIGQYLWGKRAGFFLFFFLFLFGLFLLIVNRLACSSLSAGPL